MNQRRIIANADGGCRNGNGTPTAIGAYGWSYHFEGDEDSLILGDGMVPAMEGISMTNNIAEYWGAIDLLHSLSNRIQNREEQEVLIRMDSKLVVCHFNSEWQCSSPHLKILLAKLWQISADFKNVVFKWVPREDNEVADERVNKAFDAWQKQQAE